MTEESKWPLNTSAASAQGRSHMIEALLGRLIASHPQRAAIMAGKQPLLDVFRAAQNAATKAGNSSKAELLHHMIDGAENSAADIEDAIAQFDREQSETGQDSLS